MGRSRRAGNGQGKGGATTKKDDEEGANEHEWGGQTRWQGSERRAGSKGHAPCTVTGTFVLFTA